MPGMVSIPVVRGASSFAKAVQLAHTLALTVDLEWEKTPRSASKRTLIVLTYGENTNGVRPRNKINLSES